MKWFVSFIKYNNAIPIGVTVLALGTTGAYAATNPEVIIKEEQTVVSIDNSYIASKDLSKYSPSVTVTSVTEDSDFYYVNYTLKTIDLKESVWQDVDKNQMMTVSKSSLGKYRDLGLYVAEQLNEVIGQELRRLRETQVFEKKALSKKKIATKYSGIVGGFLNAKTEEFKNYEPVVVPPEPKKEKETFAYPPTPEELAQQAADNHKPRVTLLGNSHLHIEVGDSYRDLGAIADDTEDGSVPVFLKLDGTLVDYIEIDTSKERTYTITYVATDSGGKVDEATRIIDIVDTSAVDDNTSDENSGTYDTTDNSSTSTTTVETEVGDENTASTTNTNNGDNETGTTTVETDSETPEASDSPDMPVAEPTVTPPPSIQGNASTT